MTFEQTESAANQPGGLGSVGAEPTGNTRGRRRANQQRFRTRA